jgi:transposase
MNEFTGKVEKVQSLDHLGLIAATISNLKLIEKIDKRISVSKAKGAKVSMGQRVAAMILNGLGFIDDRLYLFPDFLNNKPVDRLLGKGLKAKDFNDDILGRCLDSIYEYGVTKLFSEVAFEIGIENKLLGKSAHFDTSTISVYGEYENNEKESINITYGYSKDYRRDLKQMVINLATTGASGFPIWMEAHSGNASDKTVLQEASNRMKNFCDQLKKAPSFLYIGDSAMYENCVKKASIKWLSRVPESIKEAKILLKRETKDFIWNDEGNGYSSTALLSNYGGVQQRWLMVFSQKAYERESKTLDKKIVTEKEGLDKKLWHLSNQAFACEADARKATNKYLKSIKYHEVNWQIKIKNKQSKKGRPSKNTTCKFEYYIIGSSMPNEQAIIFQKRMKGRFILATNELDKQKLKDSEMLPEYKEQSKTESGFRFIKGKAMEVASIFLKKNSRIEALMMIMTLCLMVYSIAQHQLREALKKSNETIPNQLNKPTATPTLSWICRIFHGVSVVILKIGDFIKELVANLDDVKNRIINYFGPDAKRIYGLTM